METTTEDEEAFPHMLDETSVSSSVTSDGSDNNRLHGDGIDNNMTEDARKEQLAEAETRAVFRLRVLVILVLFLAAVAVSVVVFFITKNAQVDEFETQYEGSAEKIIESFLNIVKQKLGAISSVAVASIAHGVDHARSWPFVTLSSFQQRSATARSLSDALFVSINPFVNETQREEWEKYVVSDDSYWIAEGFAYQEQLGLDGFDQTQRESSHSIFYITESEDVKIDPGPGPYMPVWQTSPVLKRAFINQNLFRSAYAEDAKKCLETQSVVIGGFHRAPVGGPSHRDPTTSFYATLLSIAAGKTVEYNGDPMSSVYLPIFSSFRTDRRPVAVMIAVINWAAYFKKVLPPNVRGLVVVLENSCDEPFTYRIDGEEVRVVGPSDLHETAFDQHEKPASFEGYVNIADGTKFGLDLSQDKCPVTLKVYPSQTYYKTYNTKTPFIVTFAVAMVFVFTVCMFLIYDRLVERRQHIVLSRATTSTAIVSSLFPKNVRDRLMQERQLQERQLNSSNETSATTTLAAPRLRLKRFLTDVHEETSPGEQDDSLQPIANFFPHTTVLFADIAGFTAWSSTREPEMVFVLLQTLYQAFDALAKKFSVWKVETIGDSYVAVTGLPEPQERHAVIMAKFAGACLLKMRDIVNGLEVVLGPETADLGMRFGLHSGPVTAGVLRGDRARFQLFGDTVNTAARMEHTGETDLIQCSQSTADLLIKAGKSHWIKPRSEVVEAKGKGKMNTYWISPFAKRQGSSSSGGSCQMERLVCMHPSFGGQEEMLIIKQKRLVEWICELLQEHMKSIVAKRIKITGCVSGSEPVTFEPVLGQIVLDEVAESIELPEFDPRAAAESSDYQTIKVSEEVSLQLHNYVSMVAASYRNNPFHNFEHACHVTMSVNKLLKRIVAQDVELDERDRGKRASEIHDYTHGINSDPLTQFAVVYSALIHDADHSGVPNAQLIKEDPEMASLYKNKSVAEQHSFDICWDLLMSDEFVELRRYLFSTKEELVRFRQVVVNVVMATDIFDKELAESRKSRWSKAFFFVDESLDVKNLRATIVIEHIIQASDVCHTMQHWHVYRRWSKKLFKEMHQAYKSGRMEMDPSTFWYEGELKFFDNYIIPLANKLKECKIFGVSSDEYLNYALMNRAEWHDRGMEIVKELKNEFM